MFKTLKISLNKQEKSNRDKMLRETKDEPVKNSAELKSTFSEHRHQQLMKDDSFLIFHKTFHHFRRCLIKNIAPFNR